MRVAYQGEPGAFSESAVAARFGEDGVEPLPCPTFAHAFDRLLAGEAHAAVLPVENSRAGDVGEVFDLLRQHPVEVRAEINLPVRHCLLAAPGASLADIRTVRSHPQALAQCREYLHHRGMIPEPVHDTAAAARQVAGEGRPDVAAIASARAARRYGLAVLAADIQDAGDNTTRFLVLTREGEALPGRADSPAQDLNGRAESRCGRPDGEPPGRKTSLLFSVPHRPGALYRCLGVFAARGVNLTKLTSRPYPGRSWEYLFFADAEGTPEDPPLLAALQDLRQHAVHVRVLGSYPAGTPAPPCVAPAPGE